MSTPVVEIVPIIPTRRSRSPDIIDVDLLDDDDIAASQRPYQRRRRDNIIDLEEIIELPGPQAEGSSSRYRSPPPPVPRNVIPPVPSLPRHMRAFASLPTRRRVAPSPEPGVVRPYSQPFAFEAHLRDAQRTAELPPPSPAVTPAPPSHHRPIMGFGGALLAMNAQHTRDELMRRPWPRRTESARSRIRHFTQASDYIASRLGSIADRLGLLHGDLGLGGFPRIYGFPSDEHENMASDTDFLSLIPHRSHPHSESLSAPGKNAMEYKPSFTHPDNLPAGYTHDFCPPTDLTLDDDLVEGPSSVGSSSSSFLETILVCARCLDPLVIGGGPHASHTHRRLWGLRCGHIIDGKCMETLMRPEDVVEQTVGCPVSEGLCEESFIGKGKGKAADLPLVSADLSNEVSMDAPVQRKRQLRSGRTVILTDKRERVSRQRKGKGRMKPDPIERTHEWQCPVSGCGRVHQSVFISDKWKMEEKKGAIQMYV